MKMEFQVESADRSVGIMTEGFSAWVLPEENGKNDVIVNNLAHAWCDLADYSGEYETAKFDWYSNETGDKVERPKGAEMVERLLLSYAIAWYNVTAPPDSGEVE